MNKQEEIQSVSQSADFSLKAIANKKRENFFSRFPFSFSLSTLHPAFTLAEVLITLGIIGIVASMTIPTLMKNVNDVMYVSKAKKGDSVIINAMNLWKGDTDATDYSALFNVTQTANQTAANFVKYFKGGILCTAASSGVCGSAYNTKAQNGQQNPANLAIGYPRIIMADGASVLVAQNSSCSTVRTASQTDADGNTTTYDWTDTRCGWMVLDTNGIMAPNQYGIDLFKISVLTDKIINEPSPSGGLDNILISGKLTYSN